MPKKSRADAQATRQRILSSAGRLMREQGYDGVGIDEITRAAQTTPGAFYTHFRSKRALFEEVVERALLLADRGLPSIDTAADIHAFVKAYLSDKAVNTIGEGCVVAAMSADIARRSDVAQRLAARYITGVHSRIERVLKSQHGVNAGDVAWRIVSQAVGALVISRLTQSTRVARRIRKTLANSADTSA